MLQPHIYSQYFIKQHYDIEVQMWTHLQSYQRRVICELSMGLHTTCAFFFQWLSR